MPENFMFQHSHEIWFPFLTTLHLNIWNLSKILKCPVSQKCQLNGSMTRIMTSWSFVSFRPLFRTPLFMWNLLKHVFVDITCVQHTKFCKALVLDQHRKIFMRVSVFSSFFLFFFVEFLKFRKSEEVTDVISNVENIWLGP